MFHYIITTEHEGSGDTTLTREHYVAMSLLHVIDMHLARHDQHVSSTEESYLQFTVQAARGPKICVTVSTYPDADAGGPVFIMRIEI